MRKLITVFSFAALVMVSFADCTKKQLKEKEADIAMQIMTSGTWIVTKLTEGADDITPTFAGWECQFYENGTCDAIKGTTRVAGTWSASTSSHTITGQFPAGTVPIDRITGTWKIIRSNYTFGEFSQTKNNIDYKMELTKK